MDNHTLCEIGTVSNSVTEPRDNGWGDVTSRIILFPRYAAGLSGLEGFSHMIVLFLMDQADFDPGKHLRRRPQGLSTFPELGIFSQRAKHRPNPIGITAVRILQVGPDYVDVVGLDAIDKTPIIDLKPYFPPFDRVDSPSVPGWVSSLMQGYF